MSNGIDPDQDPNYVGPDLDLNCLQQRTKVTASKERVKTSKNGDRQVIPVIHHLFYKVPHNVEIDKSYNNSSCKVSNNAPSN